MNWRLYLGQSFLWVVICSGASQCLGVGRFAVAGYYDSWDQLSKWVEETESVAKEVGASAETIWKIRQRSFPLNYFRNMRRALSIIDVTVGAESLNSASKYFKEAIRPFKEELSESKQDYRLQATFPLDGRVGPVFDVFFQYAYEFRITLDSDFFYSESMGSYSAVIKRKFQHYEEELQRAVAAFQDGSITEEQSVRTLALVIFLPWMETQLANKVEWLKGPISIINWPAVALLMSVKKWMELYLGGIVSLNMLSDDVTCSSDCNQCRNLCFRYSKSSLAKGALVSVMAYTLTAISVKYLLNLKDNEMGFWAASTTTVATLTALTTASSALVARQSWKKYQTQTKARHAFLQKNQEVFSAIQRQALCGDILARPRMQVRIRDEEFMDPETIQAAEKEMQATEEAAAELAQGNRRATGKR